MAMFDEYLNRFQLDGEVPDVVNIDNDQCHHIRVKQFANIDLKLTFGLQDKEIYKLEYRIHNSSEFKSIHNIILEFDTLDTNYINSIKKIGSTTYNLNQKLYDENNLWCYLYRRRNSDMVYCIYLEDDNTIQFLYQYTVKEIDHVPDIEEIHPWDMYYFNHVYYIKRSGHIEKWYSISDIIFHKFNVIHTYDTNGEGFFAPCMLSPMILRNDIYNKITIDMEYNRRFSDTYTDENQEFIPVTNTANKSETITFNRSLKRINWSDYPVPANPNAVFISEFSENYISYIATWWRDTSEGYQSLKYEIAPSEGYTKNYASKISESDKFTIYDAYTNARLQLNPRVKDDWSGISSNEPLAYHSITFNDVIIDHEYKITILETDGTPADNNMVFNIPMEILDETDTKNVYIWSQSWHLGKLDIINDSGVPAYYLDLEELGKFPLNSKFKMDMSISEEYEDIFAFRGDTITINDYHGEPITEGSRFIRYNTHPSINEDIILYNHYIPRVTEDDVSYEMELTSTVELDVYQDYVDRIALIGDIIIYDTNRSELIRFDEIILTRSHEGKFRYDYFNPTTIEVYDRDESITFEIDLDNYTFKIYYSYPDPFTIIDKPFGYITMDSNRTSPDPDEGTTINIYMYSIDYLIENEPDLVPYVTIKVYDTFDPGEDIVEPKEFDCEIKKLN